MSDFTSQEKQARELLREHGVLAVIKPPRAGGSLNLSKGCIELKLKGIVVTHSIDLIKEIKRQVTRLLEHKPKILVIPDNLKLCRRLDPSLNLKFQLKRRCSTCPYNGKPTHCLYQRLLVEEADLYLITYDKLEMLHKTRSKLLQIICNCRVAILDEVGTRILRSPPRIELGSSENGETTKVSVLIQRQFQAELEKYEEMIRSFTYFGSKKDYWFVHFWFIVESTVCRIENIVSPGKCQNRIDEAMGPSDFKEFWKYITELTEKGKDTAILQKIFPLMLPRDVFITIKDGKVFASPVEDTLIYLREFCSTFEKGTVLLVDAYHPSLNYDRIFGRQVTPKLWNDVFLTDRKELMICDRLHLNSKYFMKSRALQNRVEDIIRSFNFDPDETFIVCLNKQTAEVVSGWNVGDTTWHRSSKTRGLQAAGKSKMFVIIGPYVPQDSFDALAYSWPDDYFLEDLDELAEDQKMKTKSSILVLNYVASEFANAIARVKDPLGKQKSLVVTVGMTQNDVKILMTQKPQLSWPQIERPRHIQPVKSGGLAKDGPLIAKLWLEEDISCVEDLPLVSRIIRYVQAKGTVSPSKILFDQTDLVRETTTKHREILEKHGVKVIFKTGGMSLEAA